RAGCTVSAVRHDIHTTWTTIPVNHSGPWRWPVSCHSDWRDSSCSAGRPSPTGGDVPVDDFDIAQSKIGESAQRVVDRAIEESRRRDHALLTNEHIFLAFAQVEWDTFSQVMRDLELNPHEILQALEEHLQVLPTFSGR